MLPVCPSVKLTLCGKAGGDKGANVTNNGESVAATTIRRFEF